jgi:hypothetical protein
MKKFGVMLAIVMSLFIVPCLAQARVVIPLPPLIPFLTPPLMVVLPDTDVYVAPDCDQDIYFSGGWWWRPWGGRWYRSLNYDSGWEFYNGVPGWYGGVYPHWRDNYRNHMWGGQRWDYHPVRYGDVRTNWKTWHDTGRYQQNWGTTGSYRQGAEARRDFRGFGQETRSQQAPVATRQGPVGTRAQQAPVATRQAPAETRGQQAPVATRQGPVGTKGQQAPVATRQAPDLSKNKNAFAGVGRGSDARIQSNRGLQSRQSMPSKGTGGVSKGNAGKGNVGRPR